MKYLVKEVHTNDNLSPIQITKGSKVRLGERSNSNGNWPNWIYCYGLDGNGEGWAPIQIIHIEDNFGTLLEDYDAYELEVYPGETVEGYKELNGWIWCKKIDGLDEGWLPKEKLSII
ncbi:MAG: ligand-binding protein SH3 [Erysipelotrichaceae bacterium]|nr:ligand-binding protein SH3 [Erysipelotrichaceae bacterium]